MAVLSQAQAVQLMAAARQAAGFAYQPYSRFSVGAALLLADGRQVTGSNVENGSYGLTLCAERVAVVKAVSEGEREFLGLAVWGADCPNGGIVPCGACLQVLCEFLPPHTPVVLADPASGELTQVGLGQLLPRAFGGPHAGSSGPDAPPLAG